MEILRTSFLTKLRIFGVVWHETSSQFTSSFNRISNHKRLNTPHPQNQLRRAGGRGVSAGLCVSGGVWESESAPQREEERKRDEEEKGVSLDPLIECYNKPPRGCRFVRKGSVIRPWCPCAVRDPVPCWLWHSSWDAALLSASARTTRSPSSWKESVSSCVTRTRLRTAGSPPLWAFQCAPPGQRWLFPPCAGPTMSRQRWATRPWPSTLTRLGFLLTLWNTVNINWFIVFNLQIYK